MICKICKAHTNKTVCVVCVHSLNCRESKVSQTRGPFTRDDIIIWAASRSHRFAKKFWNSKLVPVSKPPGYMSMTKFAFNLVKDNQGKFDIFELEKRVIESGLYKHLYKHLYRIRLNIRYMCDNRTSPKSSVKIRFKVSDNGKLYTKDYYDSANAA